MNLKAPEQSAPKHSPNRNTFLGVPIGASGTIFAPTVKAIMQIAQSRTDVDVEFCDSSALTYNFNQLYANALDKNDRTADEDKKNRWFGMIHTDVAPVDHDWLDQMIDIADESNADILSVFLAIKDERGVVSAGLDTSPFTPRRFTIAEVKKMPKTINSQYCREVYSAPLLINTGLMLIRLDRPWSKQVCFGIRNEISMSPTGGRLVHFEPEDWRFSRWANSLGLNVVATAAVKAMHIGTAAYSNHHAWGTQAVDEGNIVRSELHKAGLYTVGLPVLD